MAQPYVRRRPKHLRGQAPVRVQFWYKDTFLGHTEVRIIDGVADDVKFRAKEHIRIDRVVFIYGKRIWVAPVELEAFKGELVHIATAHMKLYDKFGVNRLG